MLMLFDVYCKKCDLTFEVCCQQKDLGRKVCPKCTLPVDRKFTPIKSIWKCEGAHKHSYTKYGIKDRTPKEYYEQRKKLQEAGKLEQIPGNNSIDI